MYKPLQAFVPKNTYSVIKITNTIKCLSSSTRACGRKVLESSSKKCAYNAFRHKHLKWLLHVCTPL